MEFRRVLFRSNPNLILPTVLTEGAKLYLNLGYQVIAGVVQHIQKDAWAEGLNDYDWGGNQSWNGYNDVVRNNDLLSKRASESSEASRGGKACVRTCRYRGSQYQYNKTRY